MHFGQLGKVSVLSLTRTTWPHLLQIYTPDPGFSPVVAIVAPLLCIPIIIVIVYFQQNLESQGIYNMQMKGRK